MRKKLAFISVEKTHPEDVPKLEKYLPVMERVARIWKVRIIANSPPSFADKIRSGKKNTLYIHFYSVPKKDDIYAIVADRTSVFGFRHTKKTTRFIIMGNKYKSGSFLQHTGRQEVAFIKDGNIYLLFDFLGREWNDGAALLQTILMLAVPRALPELKMLKRLRVIKRVLRRKFYTEKSKVYKECLKFVAHRRHCSLKDSEGELKLVAAKLEECELEYLRKKTKLHDLMEYRQNVVDRIYNDDEVFGREFDKILAMKGVVRLTVSNGAFIVLTDRILTKKKSLDIGAFEIRIDPSYDNHNQAIRFSQCRYGGQYRHSYVKEYSGVCFSNLSADNPNNLNVIIDKLLVDGEMVNLVHLILSFLRMESETERFEMLKENPQNSDAWPGPEPYSPAERERDRMAYIGLRKEIMMRKSNAQLSVDIRRTEEELLHLAGAMNKCRARKNHIRDFLNFLRSKNESGIGEAEDWLGNLFERKHSPLLFAEGDAESLKLYFKVPMSVAVLMLDGSLFIFSPTVHRGISADHRLELSPKQREEIFNALATNNILKFAYAVKEALKNNKKKVPLDGTF